MKKILISALLVAVPACAVDSAADKFVDAIEATNIKEVMTNLRCLECSEKTQEEKVALLTKIYAVAAQVTDQREQDYMSRRIVWSSGKLFRDAQAIEQEILDRLDAERVPQGDNIEESCDAVYAAIAASDLHLVKETLRVLDRKNLYGKPLEYALRGFEKAAAQLVDDRKQDLELPRTESDSFAWKLGAGLLATGAYGIYYNTTSDYVFADLDPTSTAAVLYGIVACSTGIYKLWKGGRRSEQRTLLAQAQVVHEHILARLHKVISPLAVELQPQTVTYQQLEQAIKKANLEEVRSLVWDLECSYLDDSAKEEMLDRAAAYAAEMLTKREEDMSYAGSLKSANLLRRTWQDNLKLYGSLSGIAFTTAANQILDLSYGTIALGALTAGYVGLDGWQRTTQKRLLRNAEEIKQLLRKKAN